MTWNPMGDPNRLRGTEIADAIELARKIIDPGENAVCQGRSLRELAVRLHRVLESSGLRFAETVGDVRRAIESAREADNSFVRESAGTLLEYDDETLVEAFAIVRSDASEMN